AALRKGRIQNVFEAAQDVVGVEHRIFRDLLEAVRPMAEDVGQRTREHAHLAVEGDHPAEGASMMLAGGFLLHQTELVAVALDKGKRSIRRQRLRQHDRAGAGTSSTVRSREGLVKVDMHRIDAEVAGADLSDDRVEIRAVAIDERARSMNRVADRLISGSNRPQVLGLVIITAATSGASRDLRASTSTRPAELAGMLSTR